MEYLGTQFMIELSGCEPEILDDTVKIEALMYEAALAAEATIVNQFFHQFSPYGVSGTIIISESHLNIHTWPEYGYAAIDIFTCNPKLKVEKAITYLKNALSAENCETTKMNRGLKAAFIAKTSR